MITNITERNRQLNCARFATANGWKVGKDFNVDLLISGRMHCGGDYYGNTGEYDHSLTDHPEYFRLGRYPVAIVGHNYVRDDPAYVDHLKRSFAARFDGQLVLHIPPAGKAASWYYPGGTLPMCLTRPDLTCVVWPNDQEMAATAAAHAASSDADHRYNMREIERSERKNATA
jgi:hypothetical protein